MSASWKLELGTWKVGNWKLELGSFRPVLVLLESASHTDVTVTSLLRGVLRHLWLLRDPRLERPSQVELNFSSVKFSFYSL